MERWQKTVIHWRCWEGVNTDIPITDWHEPDKNHFHTLFEIKATAMPDRKGELVLRMQRVSVSPYEKDKGIISGRIEAAMSKLGKHYTRGSSLCEQHGAWTIEFGIGDREHFCDVAIEMVRVVLQGLGVDDPSNNMLANFTIHQETYFKLDEAWVTFARWMRMKHRLAIWGPEDII